MTLANRQIVGSRKTQIMRTVYHVHTRKTLRKIIHRPVFGMIIDDKHLRLYALKCSEERIKTLLEIELHVIANDYNCNFHLIIYVGRINIINTKPEGNCYAGTSSVSDTHLAMDGYTKKTHRKRMIAI